MNTIWFPDFSVRSGPKYQVLADAIRGAIRSGALASGEKLPPVREVAYQLSITPGTVARAYSKLADTGDLDAVVGRGTFVATAQAEQDNTMRTSNPIEVDATPHDSERDRYRVNMISPHLPSVGQAKLIRQLLAEVAQHPPSGVMHYPSAASSLPARQAVAKWMSGAPLGSVHPEVVILANGGQSGIGLVLQSLLKGRRPTILVEELAYPGFRRAAELLRADVIDVAMDEDGIIPADLEAKARAHDAQILCTSPEVHNPTCGFTPEARRREIAKCARKLNLEILEDDCYRTSAPQAISYRALAPERTWFVASISKTLTPALRLGFVLAPDEKAAHLRRAAEQSFFGLATPLTDLCAKLLTHPELPSLTAKITAQTNAYVEATVNILGGYDLKWRKDGLFLWLSLPEGWRANAFCQAAEAEGVQIRSAEDYQGRDAQTRHCVRIAVNAGVSLESHERAIARLRALLDNPPGQIGV
ncbi:MAG: PLP-dependent aminotransferase family protein [Pseudomonadota bacterium]